MIESGQIRRGRSIEGFALPMARHLDVILLSVTLGCVAIAGIAWTNQWPVSFAIAVASTVLALTAAGLAWSGRSRAASVLLVLLMLGATLVSAARGDGLHDVTLVIIPATILVSSLLLERRATIALTLAAIGGVVAVAWARHERRVEAPWESDWIAEAAVVVVVLVIVTVVIQLLIGDLLTSVQRVRESEARHRDMFVSIQDAYCEIAPGGTLLEINPSGEDLLGTARDELIQRPLAGGFFEPGAFASFAAAVERHGRVANYEMTLQDAAGRRHALLVNASWRAGGEAVSSRIIASIRDVTERQELRERLARVEQLETVGVLAGGIAHDLNNLGNVIRGHCEVARRRLARGDSVEPSLEAILRASERGGQLVQALLAFARKQPHQPRLIDLNALVAEAPRLPGAGEIPGVEVQVRLGECVPRVMADPSQVEQILVNLIANAGQALSARRSDAPPGFVAISTAVLADKPGFAVLEVRDNGPGMSESVRRRIFEPFFTTRPEGTGLGLASVFGIVRQNGATIDVESSEGRGTTFRILWPAAMPAAGQAVASEP